LIATALSSSLKTAFEKLVNKQLSSFEIANAALPIPALRASIVVLKKPAAVLGT
jgi:hypothetical protein